MKVSLTVASQEGEFELLVRLDSMYTAIHWNIASEIFSTIINLLLFFHTSSPACDLIGQEVKKVLRGLGASLERSQHSAVSRTSAVAPFLKQLRYPCLVSYLGF